MLSTLTIISIFTEIFAAGIMIGGAATFFKSYLSGRQKKDLLLFFLFLVLALYVAATIASQLMFNLGSGLSELFVVQKNIAVMIVVATVLLWSFIMVRFKLKRFRLVSFLAVLLVALISLSRLLTSSLNLIYREGTIEPIVDFSNYVPVKPFLAVMFVVLFFFAIFSALASKGGRRNLFFYLASAAVLFLVAMVCSFLYVRFGEAGYLLCSWILTLFAGLTLLLAEIIPENSLEANYPLRFFRSRLLFKLILIFVLLIVILFETTTLATINISKKALSQEITNNYLRQAENLGKEISDYSGQPSPAVLQQIVGSTKIGVGVAFVVDNYGRLLAHPDKKRALQKEDLTSNQAVAFLLSGKGASGEFRDELGALMVGAYVPVSKYGWGVVVQAPREKAYFELRRVETNSLVLVILGILLTAVVGIFFAWSIEKPIKELTVGTEAVAKGQLHWKSRIDSVDEIGRLAVAFNQMTQELRDSQERLVLSEKLSSLGTMAAGMAHEIKNPLVSIRTFTQLLIQKWDDQEFREKFAAIIPQEIERINRIAESLLKFGKPMKPEHKKVDVNALLEEVLLLFESECKKYNIRMTKKLAELPYIVADAGQLQQAFVNIVKNAIESMQDKGGELVIKSDQGEIIHLSRMDKEGHKVGNEMVWGEAEEQGEPVPVVFIEISDSGEGIPEGNIKTLFDPFFTTKMTGTGMGLPITLRIIEEHQGSIKVRSQEGKGTTFIITLPAKGQED